MAKKLDPRLIEILKEYGEDPNEALWDCHGTWVAYHKAIERIAAKAGIVFDMPQIVEANTAAKTATIAVRGVMGERVEWSFGEASPANNKNAYPFAMAEKRAKDRVVIKLVGLAGIYSEEEADDFNQSSYARDKAYMEGLENGRDYAEREQPPRKANGLPEVGWREDGSRTSYWLKNNGSAEELKAQLYEDAVDCHSLAQLAKLKEFYRGKAKELKWNRQFLDVLTEEFAAIERSIMNAMEASELADVPLDKALKQSVLLAGE